MRYTTGDSILIIQPAMETTANCPVSAEGRCAKERTDADINSQNL